MATAQIEVDWQSTKGTVSERNRHMFNNSDMSDISFTCEGSDKIFYAHKYVLGTSSVVFKAMFYGDLAEKNSVVHITDTDEKSFEEFMRFLYTDVCDLTADNAVLIMYLSKKYMVLSLTLKCVNILKISINAGNATTILEHAVHFDEKNLEDSCWEVIKSNTKEVVVSKHFNDISQTTLPGVLKLDCVDVSEVELFQAVLNWSDLQCLKKGIEPTRENKRSLIGDAIYDFRFLAMSQYEFTENVVASELLTAEEMIPIYRKFSGIESPDLKWKLSDKRSRQESIAKSDCIKPRNCSIYVRPGKLKKKKRKNNTYSKYVCNRPYPY